MEPTLIRILAQFARSPIAWPRAATAHFAAVLAVLWLLALSLSAGPVHAADGRQANCYANVPDVAEATENAGAGLVWDCAKGTPSIVQENVAVRLTLDPAKSATPPEFFRTRNGLFDSLTVIAVDRDGSSRALSYGIDEVEPEAINSKYVVRLPAISPDTTEVVAIFERPDVGAMLEVAELTQERAIDAEGGLSALLLVAFLCGVLLLPMIFDVVFYRALPERNVLWHAVMCGALSFHLACGGLILFAADIAPSTLFMAGTISFSTLMVAAFMFSHAIIERDMLHPALRRCLAGCAFAAAILLGLRYLPIEAMRPYGLLIYFAGHAPMLLVLVACAVNAWMRGSRSIRFLVVAWAPFFVLGVIRVVTYLTPLSPPMDALWLFRIAGVFEVVVTSIAVIDRFASMRRQRDSALEEASRVMSMAEHDQLTGLFNRRALESRFEDLRFKGFRAFALLDLDRFKQVNDTQGHTVGDEVLAAIGAALDAHPDRDVRAFRLGGEEFVLMLRGPGALNRAEALRHMIPGQIAARVEGLGGPVTASMGIVEVPRDDAAAMQLSDLYARADKLLYEAKANGRNRTESASLDIDALSVTTKQASPASDRRSNRSAAA